MTDQITINASSTLAQGVGAHVTVIVDGQTVGSTMIGTSAANYTFTANLTAGTAHDVQVVYDNDTVVAGQDRNLALNSISIDGQTFAATSGYEVYHASGQGNLASDGAMYWNGTAEFSLPASLFAATSSGGTTAAAPGFYVSTTGSDSGDGSVAHPFATLARAVSAMESSGTHTTYMEGGTYNVGSTVNLSAADSGMTIESAPGQTALLDGGGASRTLIQLNGASGVTLQGLTFQSTSASAVVLNGASHNTIVGNHFLNTGEGLLLASGSSSNTVSGNELDNSAGSAVEVQDGSNGNTFDSNIVNGTGAIGTTGGGFFLHGVDNNAITHNLVENTAGVGIGIENWDSSTINIGNSVVGNIVENTDTNPASTDGGAIYMLGRSDVNTQSVISNNYVSGSANNQHLVGIYLDELTSGVQVSDNIVVGMPTHALQIHGGSNVTVDNNIFDLGAASGTSWGKDSAILFQSIDGVAMQNNVVTQNIITSTSPTPLSYSNLDGGNPTINDNFYMDSLNDQFQVAGDALQETNAHYGNAEFADQAAGNYALGSNSDAYSAGFVSINQSAMGPHPVTAHWYA